MPRPTTKDDLLIAAKAQYTKLWQLINALSEEQQKQPFAFDPPAQGKEAHWHRDKNLRDVLIHLHEWHNLLLSWVDSNQQGIPKPFLLEPYNWKTYGEMNVLFWENHQTTTYSKAKELLEETHEQVLKLIDTFTNEELFSKGTFTWVGGSTLGSYCVSLTATHYDWAIKKVKAHIKTLR